MAEPGPRLPCRARAARGAALGTGCDPGGGPLPLCCCPGLVAGGQSPLQLAPGWGSGGVGTPRCTLGGLRASWVLPPCSGRVCSLPCRSSRWKTSAAGVVQATWAGTAQRAKVRGRERRIPALERGEGGKPSGSAFVCTTIKANSVVLPGPLGARSHLCRALCAPAAASSSARQRQRVQRRHPTPKTLCAANPLPGPVLGSRAEQSSPTLCAEPGGVVLPGCPRRTRGSAGATRGPPALHSRSQLSLGEKPIWGGSVLAQVGLRRFFARKKSRIPPVLPRGGGPCVSVPAELAG